MSENILEQLQSLLAKQSASAGWNEPATPALGIQGVGIPVSVNTSAGKVRCYFWLGPECAASPAALQNTIKSLIDQGIPVDSWQDRNGWSESRKSSGWRR